MKKIINKLLYNIQWRVYAIHPKPHLNFIKHHFKGKEIVGCEIGVLEGKGSLSYLNHLPNLTSLVLVDPYKQYNETYDHIKNEKNMRMLLREYEKVIFFKKTSDEFFKNNNNRFDFIYVDGDHRYEQVLKDLRNGWNHLNDGGVLAGDDLPSYGVLKAVIDFSKEIKQYPLADERDFWLIKQ